MGLTTGIVGMPNVGKSTLFNALTKAGAEAANYPFCTIDPNVGVVEVPDERLMVLEKIYHSKRVVPTTFSFVDIAGLVKGASQGEGLGNQFLSHIREVDAVVHVVRCFEDENITHVAGSISPRNDIETVETELILADIQTLERRLEKAKKNVKSGSKEAAEELALIEKVLESLDAGSPVRALALEEEERKLVKSLNLLTQKPVLYVANISEEDLLEGKENLYVEQVQELAKQEGAEAVLINAKMESEIADLEEEEKALFLSELGLEETGLDRLIKKVYQLLGLITFLTAGEQEVRAWTVRRGTKAPQAASVIHSDFERGFIRAEVVSFRDLEAAGSLAAAREKGQLRLEGKDYVVQDGDVIHFRFNV